MRKISFTEAFQLINEGMIDYYHFATHNATISDHQWLLSLSDEKLTGKNLEIDPYECAQLLTKLQKQSNDGRTAFSSNGAGPSGYP